MARGYTLPIALSRKPLPAGAERATDLERRLSTLADRVEIEALFVAYAAFYDAPDMPAFADLFTEDGELIVDGRRWAGRASILSELGARRDAFGATAHFTPLNVNLTLQGDGRVHALSRFLVRRSVDGRPSLNSGVYRDRLRIVDGRWRFESRHIERDVPGFLIP